MGYAYYKSHGRHLGYGVLATCDYRGCSQEIDRGLGYLCGTSPHDIIKRWSEEPGCGRYYCSKHLGWVGPRGGCSHKSKLSWGKDLSCLQLNEDGSIICLYQKNHKIPHAWEDENMDGWPSLERLLS